MRQDHRGLPLVGGSGGIGGKNFHQVMAAALEPVDLLVGHALRQLHQLGVLAKEVVAVVAAVLGGKGLHLPIDRVGKGPGQRAAVVTRKQAVPVAAPDQLDHMPACAGKQLLQLVNDAAVAAHRAVQSLQIAVDHPGQVVQPFACGQGEGAHGLGLVHFTVAKHAPHSALPAVQQLPVAQVAHEAGLKNRADGAYAHGAGGKLPKIGHQPGVRVARQPPRADAGTSARCAQFLAVMHQVGLVEPAFQKGTGIDAGRAVWLEEHQVAQALRAAAAKEVVETGLKQVGCAGVAGDMAAELAIGLVGAHHHHQRVPAHDGRQAFLDRQITRERRLALNGDAVDIGGARCGLPVHAVAVCEPGQLVQNKAGALRTLALQQRDKACAPFGGFLRVRVGGRVCRAEQLGEERCIHSV